MTLLPLLLPFIGTLLGASIPIALGFIYYRFQKKQDRKERIFFEKREVYRECLLLIGQYVANRAMDKDADVPATEVHELLEKLALIRLVGSEKVIEAALEVSGYSDAKENKNRLNVGNLADEMRLDLQRFD